MRIGVLTSGGDAPGMNAAIRAVVKKGISEGNEIIGIRQGFQGLIDKKFLKLTNEEVFDIIDRGGTVLQSSRCEAFFTSKGIDLAIENIKEQGLEGMIVIGGDGSLKGALALAEKGIKVVGIPATIDNDIWGTDLTIGYDTAVNTVVHALNHIKDTALSIERFFIVEVMGRKSGAIALVAGMAIGAGTILIPEHKLNLDQLCKKIEDGFKKEKKNPIIILAEGVCTGKELETLIQDKIGIQPRVTVLGHIQRGGTPTANDRNLASMLGAKAVELLLAGRTGEMVGIMDMKLVCHPLSVVVNERKSFDESLYQLSVVLAS